MKKIIDFFDKQTRFVFLFSVVAMLIAHGFCYFNLMYAHDSLWFYDTTSTVKVSLGRWLYPTFMYIRSIAAPWLMGVFSILYVSLAVILVMKLLEFNKAQGICVSLLFTTSITLTALFCTYIFDADADCFALLLACFAVYAFKKFPKIINIIVSGISITLCLALYQAYICVSIGLFFYLDIMKSKDVKNWKEVLKLFLYGLKEILALVIGVAIYIPMMHLMAKAYDAILSTGYNGAGLLSSLTIGDIIRALPGTYSFFFNNFFTVTPYNRLAIVIVYWILAAVGLVSFVAYLCLNRPFWGSLVIVIPLLLLLPLALNAIYLVSFGAIHQLMIFAFCLAILLPLVFSNMTKKPEEGKLKDSKFPNLVKKGINAAILIGVFCISFNNVTYSNGAYTYRKLVYDNTALHAQTIWDDVNNVEGYEEGKTEVVFMGSFITSKAAYKSSVGDDYYGVLTGVYPSAMSYVDTETSYFYAILGRNMVISYPDDSLKENETYLAMPSYPVEGYCQMIDNKVVVKLNG